MNRLLTSLTRLTALLLLASPASTSAQAGSWPVTHQLASWVTTTLEHNLSEKASFFFDGHWRRMGLGEEPQQLLLRPGLLYTIAPGVRVGGGYAYIATAPYGELPTATPLREHRAWQQLTLAHAAGRFAVVHRYRTEQRWIAPVLGDGTGDFEYQQRVRYMARAQAPLGGLTRNDRPVIAFALDEILLPVGHGGAIGRFAQNRFNLGVGIPVAKRQRIDLGYLNLWNSLPARPANEVNHTVTINWVITSGR